MNNAWIVCVNCKDVPMVCLEPRYMDSNLIYTKEDIPDKCQHKKEILEYLEE